VDVRDVAIGMLLAFGRGRAGERYLLNAKNLTIAAFFQRLERLTGIRAPRLRMPASRPLALGMNTLFTRAVRAIGGTPPVDEVSVEMAQYYWYCDSAAERELGWVPRIPAKGCATRSAIGSRAVPLTGARSEPKPFNQRRVTLIQRLAGPRHDLAR
jgi:nucleoside-diphosphate-sugar epimerase